MSRALLLATGGDLIAEVGRLLPDLGNDLEKSLVIFPGKRPGLSVNRALAGKIGKAFAGPQICAIDEWIDLACEELGLISKPISAADGIAMLYKLHLESGSFGAGEKTHNLDDFAPWGFKLYSDFEELFIEGVAPEKLKGCQTLAEEKIPPRMQQAFTNLSGLYRSFYQMLETQNLSTRASRYVKVSIEMDNLDLSRHSDIILAGFYALTRTEQMIFKKLLGHDRTTIVLQDGPGIEGIINILGLKPEKLRHSAPETRLHYHKSRDIHGEVFGLNRVLDPSDQGGPAAIVLPSAESLFPVVEYTLPLCGDKWNISMGYPLFRTPVYALIETLRRALERKQDGRYYAPDYLKLFLHPYLKNIRLGDSVQAGRILFHTIENELSQRQARFVSLEEMERDQELMGKCSLNEKVNLTREVLQKHLAEIHQMALKNFDQIGNIGDFAARIEELISYISQQGSANRHPYTPAFIEALLSGLEELRQSMLAGQAFDQIGSYFRFLEHFIKSISVPFQRTSAKGLQVLGMMETRGLKFKQVFFLDANEGTFPPGKSTDTLLPHSLRQELGLSGYREREMIFSYYFENLIFGSEQAHIFYREGGGQQKSRFVEELIWRKQQKMKTLESDVQNPIFFKSSFGYSDPAPVAKTPEVLSKLGGLSFSPTMLDAYLKCPLQFYYRYILRLEEKEDTCQDIDQAAIGTLVHRILQEFFSQRGKGELNISQPDRDEIIDISRKTFNSEFGESLGGPVYLIKLQVENRLNSILEYHRDKLPGIKILRTEIKLEGEIELADRRMIKINGRIDRIDRRRNETVILDYKTGTVAQKPNNQKVLLNDRENWHQTVRSLQLPFYLLLHRHRYPEAPLALLNSGLMLLGGKTIKEEFLFLPGDDRQALFELYGGVVRELISEILNPDIPFSDNPDPNKYCSYCSYKPICGRQWVKQ